MSFATIRFFAVMPDVEGSAAREVSTEVREPQEREGLGFSRAMPFSILDGEPPELDQTRLIRMQFQTEPHQPVPETQGSATLNSFGPNMSLANDLLAEGQRATVLEFFALCRRFWKSGSKKLDDWTAMVNGSGVPDFGANLLNW